MFQMFQAQPLGSTEIIGRRDLLRAEGGIPALSRNLGHFPLGCPGKPGPGWEELFPPPALLGILSQLLARPGEIPALWGRLEIQTAWSSSLIPPPGKGIPGEWEGMGQLLSADKEGWGRGESHSHLAKGSQTDPSQINPSRVNPSQMDPSQTDLSQFNPLLINPSQIDPPGIPRIPAAAGDTFLCPCVPTQQTIPGEFIPTVPMGSRGFGIFWSCSGVGFPQGQKMNADN